ncbi:MAG: RNA polymerase sigma-H factor [Fimbriimonadales bacterium]|nr:MAG: RNA polymerase sigma-H factor [Fimbriimonadales bacterium]
MKTDRELIEQIREGREQANRAYGELVSRHAGTVLGICRRYFKQSDEAEDVAQEIWIKVLENIDQYDPEQGEFAAWLKTVAGNACKDYLRKKKEGDSEPVEEMAGEGEPDTQWARQESHLLIQEVIAKMPPRLGLIAWMHYYDHMGLEDIASLLQVHLGEVRSLKQSADTWIRITLHKQGTGKCDA